MKSHTIEMTRSVGRKLPGGEIETLSAGQRYTVDDATAQWLANPTTEQQSVNGALQDVEVPPAAVIVETYEIETGDERIAREAKEAAATTATPVAGVPVTDGADEDEE